MIAGETYIVANYTADVLRLHDDKEDPTDEELRANAREYFLFLGAAWKHAANAASVLILGYFLNRFRGKSA